MVTPNTMALLKQHLAITGGQVRPCPPAQQFPARAALLCQAPASWVGCWGDTQLTGGTARGSTHVARGALWDRWGLVSVPLLSRRGRVSCQRTEVSSSPPCRFGHGSLLSPMGSCTSATPRPSTLTLAMPR